MYEVNKSLACRRLWILETFKCVQLFSVRETNTSGQSFHGICKWRKLATVTYSLTIITTLFLPRAWFLGGDDDSLDFYLSQHP